MVLPFPVDVAGFSPKGDACSFPVFTTVGANYGQRPTDQLPMDFNSMVFATVELGMHCYYDLVGLIYIFCEYKCECYAYFRRNRTLHADIRGWDLSELTQHIGM